MPRYMLRREFDALSMDEFMALAESSTAIREAQFPVIGWDRTHVIQRASGWTTYCIYDAPDTQVLMDYSTVAGLPVDEVDEIAMDVVPELPAAAGR